MKTVKFVMNIKFKRQLMEEMMGVLTPVVKNLGMNGKIGRKKADENKICEGNCGECCCGWNILIRRESRGAYHMDKENVAVIKNMLFLSSGMQKNHYLSQNAWI